MQQKNGSIQLSASDLVGYLNCDHLAQLELGAARGQWKRPVHTNAAIELLWTRGLLHEQRRVNRLASARTIRTAAMAVLMREGKRDVVAGHPVERVEFDSLHIFYSTTRRIAQKPQLRGTDLPSQEGAEEYAWMCTYGLNIWYATKGKVFNLVWSKNDCQIDLVRFKYGEWEDILRRRAALFDAALLAETYTSLPNVAPAKLVKMRFERGRQSAPDAHCAAREESAR